MRKKLNLFISITPHGFGHAAQSVTVINSFARQYDLNLTIQSDLPSDLLQSKICTDFTQVQSIADFGMSMFNPMDVDIEKSHAKYINVLKNKTRLINQQTYLLSKYKPDVVLSNISPLTCLAAKKLGIPNFAFSSLNWADIYASYCSDCDDSEKIHEFLLSGYQSANAVFALTPSMPMHSLNNTITVPPVVESMPAKRTNKNIAVNFDTPKVALMAFGGIDFDVDFSDLTLPPNWTMLVPSRYASKHKRLVSVDDIDVSFLELLDFSDLVISKPGYGTFVSAAYYQVPIMYLARERWPESQYLVSWIETHGKSMQIKIEDLISGKIFENYLNLSNQSWGAFDAVGENQIMEEVAKHI